MAEQIGDILSQPVFPEQVPNLTPKNPPKIVFFVVFVLMLSGAVFAGIQIGQKQKPKTPGEILFNQPTISVPTPTPDLTEEWKTYTNDKMKFSIKYPPDWFAHKETLYPITEGRTSERYEAVFSFPVDNPSPQDFIDRQKAGINITYTPKPEWSFTYYINKLMSQDWGATPYQSETLVADIKATVIGIGNPPKNIYVIFDKNGRYFIGLIIEKNETHEIYSQLFDQILATFKFLDSSQSETEGWKTYENENAQIKYSIKYPPNWIIDAHETGPRGAGYDTSRDNLILKRSTGDYQLSVYSSSTTFGGESPCGFSDYKNEWQGITEAFSNYVEFTAGGVTYRRARTAEGYKLCEKKPQGFSLDTSFGNIMYFVPVNELTEVLKEMDSIVKTLQIIK